MLGASHASVAAGGGPATGFDPNQCPDHAGTLAYNPPSAATTRARQAGSSFARVVRSRASARTRTTSGAYDPSASVSAESRRTGSASAAASAPASQAFRSRIARRIDQATVGSGSLRLA